MHLEVTFKNLRPRDEIRRRGEALYTKLERFLDPAASAELIVQVEHGKAVLELIVHSKGQSVAVQEEDDELRTALDKLFHRMELALRRRKEKRIDRRRRGGHDDDGFVIPEEGEEEALA
jgi:ribosomal subunit interface protein